MKRSLYFLLLITINSFAQDFDDMNKKELKSSINRLVIQKDSLSRIIRDLKYLTNEMEENITKLEKSNQDLKREIENGKVEIKRNREENDKLIEEKNRINKKLELVKSQNVVQEDSLQKLLMEMENWKLKSINLQLEIETLLKSTLEDSEQIEMNDMGIINAPDGLIYRKGVKGDLNHDGNDDFAFVYTNCSEEHFLVLNIWSNAKSEYQIHSAIDIGAFWNGSMIYGENNTSFNIYDGKLSFDNGDGMGLYSGSDVESWDITFVLNSNNQLELIYYSSLYLNRNSLVSSSKEIDFLLGKALFKGENKQEGAEEEDEELIHFENTCSFSNKTKFLAGKFSFSEIQDFISNSCSN
jgi:hypothetical protein